MSEVGSHQGCRMTGRPSGQWAARRDQGEGLMGRERDFAHIPIIDVSELVAAGSCPPAVALRLGAACRESGFFYVVGHGVDAALQGRLRDLSREFFAQDLPTKFAIRMALGGRAWRGYFRRGGELTSRTPDHQEGLYFR